tara:strand:+ start:3058 stop:3771 length:714 start_codon:yes stop_codon:yes gene_type:complete
MSNYKNADFYFGISDNKIYICFIDNKKNKLSNSVSFDVPDSLSNNLNFKIILSLLRKNIRKLEKDIGLFVNSGNISIKSKSYQSILFSVKDIFDERELEKEVIIKLVRVAMQQLQKCEKNLTIIHVIINKYVIDDKVYNFFPNYKKFTKIILEIEFICLNKILIEKVKKLFNECKIDVKKIVSYDYAKKFLNNIKDDTLCLSAYEILNGANQSEVILTENTSKKHSLFDKIFNFFDK